MNDNDQIHDHHNEKGLDMLNIQQFDAAITHFTKALEAKPSSTAYENRACAKHLSGDYAGALEDFDKSFTMLEEMQASGQYDTDLMNRDIMVSLISRSESLSALKRQKEVIETIDKALTYYPQDNELIVPPPHSIGLCYATRAFAKLDIEDFNGAVLDAKQALKENVTGEVKDALNTIIDRHSHQIDPDADSEVFTFEISGKEIKIEVRKVPGPLDHVFVPFDKPINSEHFGDMIITVDRSEFIDDIKQLLPSTLDGELGEELDKSFERCLQNHINEHRRILDPDIELYIAEQILIVQAISIALNRAPITRKQRQDIFVRQFNRIKEAMEQQRQ